MNESELTAEQEQRLAERQARQNGELTRDEVLRRNSVERIKHDQPPAALAGEFARLAGTPYVAVPEKDILLLQWHGLYHGKPKIGSFMMRVKIPNGILKSAQLRAVGELAVRQGNNQVEITTRQDLQLHGIRPETMQEAFATLQQAGLSTRAGCGDTLRNTRAGGWWWEPNAPKECAVHCAIETGSLEHEVEMILGAAAHAQETACTPDGKP